jgi:small subunit ribosomal protein S21
MLPRTAANDENSHGQKDLGRGDYFVDLDRDLRLESALTRDSLTYLVGLLRAEKGLHSVAEVKIQEGESIESALRRFKRKVQQEDIIKDIKKHSFYLKPGDKRRAKQALARKRNRKKLRRETE